MSAASGRGRRRLVAPALLASLLLGGSAPSYPAVRSSPQDVDFTVEDLLSISHPGPPVWSPDGGRIAFARERDGAVDLWWTSEAREEPEAVTREAGKDEPGSVGAFAWTPSGDGLLYLLHSRLLLYDVGSASSTTLLDGGVSALSLAADGTRIALLRDGRPWVGSFPGMEGDFALTSDDTFRSLERSPDGRYLAVTAGDSRVVTEDTRALMGDKMSFSRRDSDPADLAVIDTRQGAIHWLERGDAYAGSAAFSSGGLLAWQEISGDGKGRRILVAAAPEWSPRVLVDESDDAWWTLTYLDGGPRWSPSDERLVYISEADGWAHLYLVDAAGSAPRQLTRGDFEVEEPSWSPDGRRLLVSANWGSLTERGLHLLDLSDLPESGEPALEPISRLRGTSTFGRWRPDGGAIAFLHADPENPLDLWVKAPGPREAKQLSDSWPEEADEGELVKPQTVRFSSADGALIPAQLFLPPAAARGREPLPAVVWAHGGGIRQNRYGWHPMHAYAVFYGFHQYLLQRGYAVVAVDYRGSIGYGRAFRQAQYMDLGGRDLDDVLGAVRYLRRIEDVEIGRIGLWGISYGGYLTLQALVQAPGAFDAGVDVAGVADWVDWATDPGGLWIDGRMGDPAVSAELYRQRSPLHFAERLSSPLLILHGTADRNVPVLQAFKLTDALVGAGKPFDLMIYPGEQHAFVRSRTWRDAFRRVEQFFDSTLR